MNDALCCWTEDQLRRLSGAGAVAHWQPLRVEASHRRFYRISWRGADHASATTFVAMSSPPERENNRQFVTLVRLFAGHGIGVPRLLAADEELGYFLVSDLGENHFEDVYHRQGPQSVLPAALDTLHLLQKIHHPAIPPYTRERFETELGIYVTWCLGHLLNMQAPPSLSDAFEQLVDSTQAQPSCCVHRDYHCRNLLLTPEGTLGVVDFQDALMGPATYDLASLLRDCYYRFDDADVARWRDAWLAGTSLEVDRSRFARDLDFTALQRQLKAVGIFARLSLRDGRETHLSHIVPVLERIETLSRAYPELSCLTEHTADVLPDARRRLGTEA